MTPARQAAILQGTLLDREITAHINDGRPLTSPRAVAVLAVLPSLVKPHRVSRLESQVPVCNMARRIATGADIVVHGARSESVVVELKYYTRSDSDYAFSSAGGRLVPRNSVIHAKYMTQLARTMLLYARTKRRRAGAVLKGALVVATSTKPLVFHRQIVYTPNTGINSNRRQYA
jgi:hypothetical protein